MVRLGHCIKQNRRSANALFAQITTSGYAGNYKLDRLTHHCRIVETENEYFRFQQSSMDAKGRIKAREQRCKGGKGASPEEPF